MNGAALDPATLHPANARRSPEVGAGPFGYQLRTRPGATYRLVASERQIPGLPASDEGILMDVADEEGYTRFVRMPEPVPDGAWTLLEVVGEADIHSPDCQGTAFQFVDEADEQQPVADYPYAIELERGPVFHGRSDQHGYTVYVVAMDPREATLYYDPDGAEDDATEQLLFDAEVYAGRTGDLEENLSRIDALFRRDEAVQLTCPLHAWRAAFLVSNQRQDLAEQDIAALLACSEASGDMAEPLGTIVEALARDPSRAGEAGILRTLIAPGPESPFGDEGPAFDEDP